MDYVTDTHSLVWYFTDDQRLGKNALIAFERTVTSGTVIVPSIVLAEIMFIARKGRVTLSFDDTLTKIEESDNYSIAPLDEDILKEANRIEPNLEMHDRLIVATALFYKTELITKNDVIKEAGIIKTIW